MEMKNLVIHLALTRAVIFTFTDALEFELSLFEALLTVAFGLISWLESNHSGVPHFDEDGVVLLE